MQPMKARVLYLDEDAQRSFTVACRLMLERYEPVTTEFASYALKLAESQPFDAFLLSKRFPVESGNYLCQKLHETSPQTPIIFFSSAKDDGNEWVHAVQSGAKEYIIEGDNFAELLKTLDVVTNDPQTT